MVFFSRKKSSAKNTGKQKTASTAYFREAIPLTV